MIRSYLVIEHMCSITLNTKLSQLGSWMYQVHLRSSDSFTELAPYSRMPDALVYDIRSDVPPEVGALARQ